MAENKQYHYVVQYDVNTKSFYIDWDVTAVVLDEDRGTIFDTRTEEWVSYLENPELEQDYKDHSDILADALNDYNNLRNEE